MSSLAKNTALIGGSRMFSRALGLISTFVVARLLTPNDYAVIATCMLVQDFAMRLENIGFGQNIISKDKLSPTFIGTMFKTRLFVGFILFTATFGVSGYAASYFEDSQVENVLKVISFIFIIKPLTNISIITAIRDKFFTPSIKIQVYAKILSVFCTISLAFIIENYWALAIGMVVNCIASVCFSYMVLKAANLTHFSFNEAKQIFTFSKWHLLTQIVEFANVKANIFLVAKIFEKKLVGFFSLGGEICLMYSMEISHAIDKANLSELAEKKRNSQNFKTVLLDNVSVNLAIKSLLLLPVYLTFIIYPDFVINILLGDNWSELAPFFQLFAVSSLVVGYASTFYNSLIVYRVPKLSFYVSLAMLFLRIPVLYVSFLYKNPYFLIIGGAILHFARLVFFQLLLSIKSNVKFLTFTKLLFRESLFLLVGLACYLLPSLIDVSDFFNVTISCIGYAVCVITISYFLPNSEIGKLLTITKKQVSSIVFRNVNN